MRKEDTEVLVIPRHLLFPLGEFHGFQKANNWQNLQDLIHNQGRYRRRGDVEENPNFKQIIPQVAVVHDKKVFVHEIPPTGGEARLHGQWPIFLGGHMDNSTESITDAARREVAEELGIERGRLYQGERPALSGFRAHFLGFVNSEATPVSAVHLGVVFVYIADGLPEVATGDDGVSKGQWVSLPEIDVRWKHLTEWSQLAWHDVRGFVNALD